MVQQNPFGHEDTCTCQECKMWRLTLLAEAADRLFNGPAVPKVACWNCGSQVVPNKFCSQCGKPLEKPCGHCQTVNDHSAKFCKHCGGRFGISV